MPSSAFKPNLNNLSYYSDIKLVKDYQSNEY